jgi:hypothetical protein
MAKNRINKSVQFLLAIGVIASTTSVLLNFLMADVTNSITEIEYCASINTMLAVDAHLNNSIAESQDYMTEAKNQLNKRNDLYKAKEFWSFGASLAIFVAFFFEFMAIIVSFFALFKREDSCFGQYIELNKDRIDTSDK